MSFHHKGTIFGDHKHDTVDEAKACEQEEAPTPQQGPQHQTPCRCGTYDLCWEFRVEKQHHGTLSGSLSALHEAGVIARVVTTQR